MYARARVADRTGLILAEIEPEIGPISWRLNETGRAAFVLSKSDAKATEDYLRFGNRIYIEFDNGLPAWGGVIAPPRTWERATIESTAYSGEKLLEFRQTDKGRYFSTANIGYMFQQLIIEANSVAATGVQVGSVWGGGDAYSPEYHFKNLLKIITESLTGTLSSADFAIIPAVVDGRIAFAGHLYERRGQTKSGIALVEDRNVVNAKLVEQGTIVNAWDLAGAGTDWGDGRITSHKEDAESIAEFGLRQDSQIYSDVSIQATLDAIAVNLLEETAQPRNMLTLAVSDTEPARFGDYDVGDSVPVQLPSYGFGGGFDATVRILAREYDPRSGVCELVVREE